MKPPFKLYLTALCILITSGLYAQTVKLNDKAFVDKVSQGGMFEVAAGRLAIIKGSTQDIRDFATAEVHDHTLVGAKLKRISRQAGITFPSALNIEFSSKLQHLSSLSGQLFDKDYLKEMSALHDMDGSAFGKESSDGGSPAFRAFGSETHKIVQRHIGAIRAVPLN